MESSTELQYLYLVGSQYVLVVVKLATCVVSVRVMRDNVETCVVQKQVTDTDGASGDVSYMIKNVSVEYDRMIGNYAGKWYLSYV